jgi:hypothetical protein
MLGDMAVPKFSEATSRSYIRHIRRLPSSWAALPTQRPADDVRGFQVHIGEGGTRPPKFNSATLALLSYLARTSTALSSLGIPRQRALLQTAIALFARGDRLSSLSGTRTR